MCLRSRVFLVWQGTIKAPLTKLLCKNAPFVLADEHLHRVGSFLSTATLHTPIWDVLMQDGKVVAYAYQKLKSHEANYSTQPRDLDLRQCRWVELLKDYDCTIEYHPDKKNVVPDALSRRVMTDLRAMFTSLSLFDDGTLQAELQIEDGETSDFGLNSDELLCFRGQISVPNDVELRQSILREGHNSPYAMYPDRNKMYIYLCELYWWPDLK
ncbi:DNA/RNA polymerases superfamily protein [Gossypium australe]|uniref:DNA/RNA polymerases superfamily protein n=1 Tax=Gossypium australe TaxID=47621 RepID=A0A5B6VA62_9ROSI|nr:DNA/RNA polymerases superfamily protein [Gossypium australe]